MKKVLLVTAIMASFGAAAANPGPSNGDFANPDFGDGTFKLRFETEVTPECGVIFQTDQVAPLALNDDNTFNGFPTEGITFTVYDNTNGLDYAWIKSNGLNASSTIVDAANNLGMNVLEAVDLHFTGSDYSDGVVNYQDWRDASGANGIKIKQGVPVTVRARIDLWNYQVPVDNDAFVGPRLELNCF